MENTILWIHGDNLNPQGPALAAYPGAPALFVFDEALLADWQISLKRLVFLYECLLELPVTIRRGDVAAELQRFAAGRGATAVATAASPSPRFAAICEQLRQAGLAVELLEERPFVENGRYDLNRFSRYWRKAQTSALTPS